MKTALLACLLTCFSLTSPAAGFAGAELAPGDGALTLVATDGARTSAPRLDEQVGFQDVRLAPGGERAGWIALYANCCTSYPIGGEVLVVDATQHLRRIRGTGLAIFAWCFHAGGREVVFREGMLHGSDYMHFERHRLSDGARLASYDYPHDPEENLAARRRAPPWVGCASD